MTRLAGHTQVQAFQLKSSFVMIEVFNPCNCRKRHTVVAFGAVLTEFVIVNILMAIGAVGGFHPFKLLEFLPVACGGFMTIGTGYLLMFPGKFKFSFLMIELCESVF